MADEQHGRISNAQLLALGFTKPAIGRRISAGQLREEHHGVYAVGHRSTTPEGIWMAATLIADDVTLGRRSGAELWRGLQPTSPVDVIVWPDPVRRPGIRAHRTQLPPSDRTFLSGIPVTTVERTAVDLAGDVELPELASFVDDVLRRRLTTLAELQRITHRHRGRRGIRLLRLVLEECALADGVTRSELERVLRRAYARFCLPMPEFNAPLEIGGIRIVADAVHRAERVIIECDGWQHHSSRSSFESDRNRDRRLLAAGWPVIRVTWRDLHDSPAAVARDIQQILRERAIGLA